WAPTFLIVILGWVMFRSPHVGDALRLYGAMFRLDGDGLSPWFAASITQLQVATLLIAFGIVALRGWQVRRGLSPTSAQASVDGDAPPGNWGLSPFLATGWLALFALSVLKLSAQSYSPFLYFQF